MKERPILFSAPMVRAILEGRKTQTRRILKHQPPDDSYRLYVNVCSTDPKVEGKLHWIKEGAEPGTVADGGQPHFTRPFQPGMRLRVRETWRGLPDHDDAFEYRADWSAEDERKYTKILPWKPSIFMPRRASRITLEVTEVRVERLQEITNSDAREEGPPSASPHRHGPEGIVKEWPGEIIPDPYAHRHQTGINDCWICAYRMIWQEINGPGSWDLNPWVFAVSFRRIEGGPQ